jgi:hypothetical protein
VQPVADVAQGRGKQGCEQMLEFVAGQRGQPGRRRVVGGFGDREHDEEGQREHGQGGPPIPRAPAADLMLIQATQALAGLERLLNPPSRMHL